MRLAELPDAHTSTPDTPPEPAPPQPESAKDKAMRLLYEGLGPKLTSSRMSEHELQAMVAAELNQIVSSLPVPLTPLERQQLMSDIVDDTMRLGPLEELLSDDTVSEIMVNAYDQVWIERAGRLHLSTVKFEDDQALLRIIERIVTRVGRRIDDSSPFVDARLQDGSRVNAIIPPLALNGPSLTIRKFPSNPLKMADLVAKRTLNQPLAEMLAGCVRGKLNILVSGGTGTGKTTLLNILSSYIPPSERVISIEDAAELQLVMPNQVRLEARPANVEGKGQVTIRELVANSLRMRPNRIVVGECRAGEALDMLQAMNTGHDGSMTTLHANSARDALSRLETLVLMAGTDLPSRAIREQIASAINLIVQISRLSDGSRRITSVTEIIGMEKDIITTQELFRFRQEGTDERGGVRGRFQSSGIRPRFTERLADHGVLFPSEWFQAA